MVISYATGMWRVIGRDTGSDSGAASGPARSLRRPLVAVWTADRGGCGIFARQIPQAPVHREG